MIARQVTAALREAAEKQVGRDATPAVCEFIKFDFLRIMQDKFQTDWSADASHISVSFRPDGMPDVTIPPRLLHRTFH